jgi:hypothetical protein
MVVIDMLRVGFAACCAPPALTLEHRVYFDLPDSIALLEVIFTTPAVKAIARLTAPGVVTVATVRRVTVFGSLVCAECGNGLDCFTIGTSLHTRRYSDSLADGATLLSFSLPIACAAPHPITRTAVGGSAVATAARRRELIERLGFSTIETRLHVPILATTYDTFGIV